MPEHYIPLQMEIQNEKLISVELIFLFNVRTFLVYRNKVKNGLFGEQNEVIIHIVMSQRRGIYLVADDK